MQSVYKVNMTKLILYKHFRMEHLKFKSDIHHSQFCDCPYKDVETFCLILFMAAKLCGKIFFFPFFLTFFLLSFLLYFI